MARTIGYAVVDLETTGLDKDGSDAIVEIAIVLLDVRGSITGYYETIVKPKRKLGATNIHKINEAMIVNAPEFGEVVNTVASLLKGRKLIAHNAEFEANFLRKEMFPHDVFITEANFIDTLKIARRVLRLKSYKLVSLTEYFQIPFFNAHTALSDTVALASVFKELKKYNKREMRRQIKKAKPFKYTGKVNYDTSVWLPRNPDAFIQTYKPYRKFNILTMFKNFKQPLSLIRHFTYTTLSLALSSLLLLKVIGIEGAGILSLTPFLYVGALYGEHRWRERLGARRNRNDKHQLGLSTVEEEGGSVEFTKEDMVPVSILEETTGKKFPDETLTEDFEPLDDFDDFLRSGEVEPHVNSDKELDDFDLWANDNLGGTQNTPETPSEAPVAPQTVDSTTTVEAEVQPLIQPSAKPKLNTIMQPEVPSFDDLLKPVNLSEVDYKTQWRTYGASPKSEDKLVYNIEAGVYTISEAEVDYVFKIVEYYIGKEQVQTGRLFDVMAINNGKINKVKKNNVRGVYDSEYDKEFSYKDASAYVLIYDAGTLIVHTDSTVAFFPHGDIGTVLSYKHEGSDKPYKIIAVDKDANDGFMIESDSVEYFIKMFRKLKIKIKSVV